MVGGGRVQMVLTSRSPYFEAVDGKVFSGFDRHLDGRGHEVADGVGQHLLSLFAGIFGLLFGGHRGHRGHRSHRRQRRLLVFVVVVHRLGRHGLETFALESRK